MVDGGRRSDGSDGIVDVTKLGRWSRCDAGGWVTR